ncbi:MAG: NAD/NADP octopine/nopaline dehydrogenase family protein [Oscillospiraceae bacterium]|jgi:opine dehydrogenase|nr:NAD/NADP octopine/nopaline dehydrogenase family protein [Oscillospiraceae bacterium]
MSAGDKIAVISTGNGGQALAAYLSMRGCEVALYARDRERVEMFKDNKFTLGGVVEGEALISLISNDMREVVTGARLVMVTTPAQYHHVVGAAMAPHLEDGQVVVLNPGRTFGTYAFKKTLEDNGCGAKILLGETDTFVFTCRSATIGRPIIYKVKNTVRAAAHEGGAMTLRLAGVLSEYFGSIVPAKSVLHTGFSNIGMIFHPMPILMNITRVEAKEDYLFYIDGISPLVAGMLEKMDAERVAVARSFGADVEDAGGWLRECYGSRGDTLYEMIQNTDAYANVLAPTDIDTRYIFEDILTGCVPVSCAGLRSGVETQVIDAVIKWASTLYDIDFRANGRNGDMLDFGEIYEMAWRLRTEEPTTIR